MPGIRQRLRASVVGAAAIALVTIGAGGTLAASTTPTLYACFNVNGQVSMATIAQCKLAGGGQLVQINAAGVPGPRGPQGLPGATGPTGPAGAGAVTTPLTLPFGTESPSFSVAGGNLVFAVQCSAAGALWVDFTHVVGRLQAMVYDGSGYDTFSMADTGTSPPVSALAGQRMDIVFADTYGAHVIVTSLEVDAAGRLCHAAATVE